MSAPDIDLLSADLYGEAARQAHRWMRANAPVHRDERNGLWGIATYDAVLAASRDPETFSNAGGSRPDTGPLPWMIDMDGSDHRKRRKIVSRGFTPGRVRASAPWVEEICDDLLDRVCEQGTCDVVRDLAAPLPMIVIGDMLGVAPEDRDLLLRWSDDLLGLHQRRPRPHRGRRGRVQRVRRLRPPDHRGPAPPARRRPHQHPRARRGRRRRPRRRRAGLRVAAHPRGRRRDHPPRHQRRGRGAARATPTSEQPCRTTPACCPPRWRRCCAGCRRSRTWPAP
jgi:hypothetical protein